MNPNIRRLHASHRKIGLVPFVSYKFFLKVFSVHRGLFRIDWYCEGSFQHEPTAEWYVERKLEIRIKGYPFGVCKHT